MRMYAHPRNGTYWYIGHTEFFVRLHDVIEVQPVEVVEATDGSYFGWLDFQDQKYHFVWPSEAQRDMCFPYGPAFDEQRSKGRRVRLSVTPVQV